MRNSIQLKVQNYYKRWNIKYKDENRVTELRNCIITSVDKILGTAFLEDDSLTRDYFRLIGQPVALSHTGFEYTISSSLKGKSFADSPVYSLFLSVSSFNKIVFYTQALFWLELNENVKQDLYKDIRDDIKWSLVPIQIKKVKNNCILYPAGAELLDQGVVNDVLGWLFDYHPEVYDKFKSALEKYENHKYTRNMIYDLRLSLELLLKSVLNTKKPLEKQKKILGSYLDKKYVSKEIRNMLSQQISYYTLYQNEHVKHNDSINKKEIEFMIYLTGTFIRFILKLESNSENQIK